MPTGMWTNDHHLRGIGRQIEVLSQKMGDIGYVITPQTPLIEAIRKMDKLGGRILLSEGTWLFYGRLDVPRSIELVSLSPGRTIFKRHASWDAASLRLTGTECVIDGVRFLDAAGVVRHTVEVTGARCFIKNCTFESVAAGVSLSGSSDYSAVQNNLFVAATADHFITGSGVDYLQITGNRFITHAAVKSSVFLDNTVEKSLVVGNVADSSAGNYRYKTGLGTVVEHNIGTVTAV